MIPKYHIVYKTTNIVNNKIYIGVHSTDDIEDGYIGCGIYSNAHSNCSKRFGLKSAFIDAVVKHGYSNFKRDILFIFDSPEEAFNKEKEIVNFEFINRKDTYNIRTGGNGGNVKLDPLFCEYEKICDLFMDGKTLKEIGKIYNTGYTRIRTILKRCKLDRRGRVMILPSFKKLGDLIPEIQDRFRRGESVSKLMKDYKVDRKTIKRYTVGIIVDLKYKAVSPTGVVVYFTNVKEFAESNNLFPGGIQNVLGNKVTNYKGWKFNKLTNN